MKKIFAFIAILMVSILSTNSTFAQNDAASRIYEMRVYYATPGNLEILIGRFRNHTIKLFEKHGMKHEGFWLPVDNKDNKLVYVLSYPSREAREKSWKNFSADPDWNKVRLETIKNGEIVGKVESTFLKTTDFSMNNMKSVGDRVFELRTYKATPDHLPNLLARFRDHTVKLFEKFGMTNIIYWTPTDKEQGADDMLIYFLTHKSKEAAAESFKNFGGSPEWNEVKKASEVKAGGTLTVYVKSEFMMPVDFSPLK
jgi:hypothetical protein